MRQFAGNAENLNGLLASAQRDTESDRRTNMGTVNLAERGEATAKQLEQTAAGN